MAENKSQEFSDNAQFLEIPLKKRKESRLFYPISASPLNTERSQDEKALKELFTSVLPFSYELSLSSDTSLKEKIYKPLPLKKENIVSNTNETENVSKENISGEVSAFDLHSSLYKENVKKENTSEYYPDYFKNNSDADFSNVFANDKSSGVEDLSYKKCNDSSSENSNVSGCRELTNIESYCANAYNSYLDRTENDNTNVGSSSFVPSKKLSENIFSKYEFQKTPVLNSVCNISTVCDDRDKTYSNCLAGKKMYDSSSSSSSVSPPLPSYKRAYYTYPLYSPSHLSPSIKEEENDKYSRVTNYRTLPVVLPSLSYSNPSNSREKHSPYFQYSRFGTKLPQHATSSTDTGHEYTVNSRTKTCKDDSSLDESLPLSSLDEHKCYSLPFLERKKSFSSNHYFENTKPKISQNSSVYEGKAYAPITKEINTSQQKLPFLIQPDEAPSSSVHFPKDEFPHKERWEKFEIKTSGPSTSSSKQGTFNACYNYLPQKKDIDYSESSKSPLDFSTWFKSNDAYFTKSETDKPALKNNISYPYTYKGKYKSDADGNISEQKTVNSESEMEKATTSNSDKTYREESEQFHDNQLYLINDSFEEEEEKQLQSTLQSKADEDSSVIQNLYHDLSSCKSNVSESSEIPSPVKKETLSCQDEDKDGIIDLCLNDDDDNSSDDVEVIEVLSPQRHSSSDLNSKGNKIYISDSDENDCKPLDEPKSSRSSIRSLYRFDSLYSKPSTSSADSVPQAYFHPLDMTKPRVSVSDRRHFKAKRASYNTDLSERNSGSKDIFESLLSSSDDDISPSSPDSVISINSSTEKSLEQSIEDEIFYSLHKAFGHKRKKTSHSKRAGSSYEIPLLTLAEDEDVVDDHESKKLKVHDRKKQSSVSRTTTHKRSNECRQELECAICLESMSSARGTSATTCGHVYCTPCINEVVEKKNECPTCRKSLDPSQVHKLFLFH